jgi:hypothetical protein
MSIEVFQTWANLRLLLLLLSVDLTSFGTRINIDDSFIYTGRVDNKRHTNAHRPLASGSPARAPIPPPPPLFRNAVKMRLFTPCSTFLPYLILFETGACGQRELFVYIFRTGH